MDINLNIIAKELFGKIRSIFPRIELRNEQNEPLADDEDVSSARFFKFDFSKQNVSLGNITVELSNDDGLVIIYSNDIVENQPDVIKHKWFNFLREMREFAKQSRLEFQARNITKNNLDRRDTKFLAKKHGESQMAESKLWGTNKVSYQNVGESRLIIKHSQPVNLDIPAGRAMHIESIYVENAQGERFKYPYRHLNGARAMAEHISHGGNPYDGIGKYISSLSEEMGQLRKFKGYVGRTPVVAEAMGEINNRVIERLGQIKEEIQKLQRSSYYEQFAESFEEKETTEIPEEIMNDWIDRLTVRSFNEELKSVFPYLYNIVGENIPVREITADDLLGEESKSYTVHCSQCGGEFKRDRKEGYSHCRDHKGQKNLDESNDEIAEMSAYERYLESIISEESALMSDNPDEQQQAIDQLNELIAEPMPLGTDGSNAIESLAGIIDDEELNQAFKEIADIDPESDAREVLKTYIQQKDEENGSDILSQLNFEEEPATEEPPAEPAAPAPTEPAAPAAAAPAAPAAAPTQPVMASIDHKGNRFAEAVRKACKAGMKAEDVFNVGGREISLRDAIQMAGLQVEDFFNEGGDSDNELVEYVESMFNAEEGSFPKGRMGVRIACEKKFGDHVGEVVERIMDKLESVSEMTKMKRLAGLDEEMPAMMDPAQMQKQQWDQMMQRNPKMQNIDPSKMSSNLHQRVQKMQQQNKAQQATLKPGEERFTVNGVPATKAEYDAEMGKLRSNAGIGAPTQRPSDDW